MSRYDSMNDKLKSTLKYKVTLIILYFKVIEEKFQYGQFLPKRIRYSKFLWESLRKLIKEVNLFTNEKEQG